MALKKNMRHPNFIIGVTSLLLLIIGIVLRADGFAAGSWVVIAAVALGAIHWIWSVVDVITGYDLNPKSRVFWMIIVLLIPPLGGLYFYMMKRKNVSM